MWIIVWVLNGELFKTSPFKTEAAAMRWARDNEFHSSSRSKDDPYDFDIHENHVYINGPSQEMRELGASDFGL